MEQRDELEIETRLRAALQARSELVTHSTLRPGIPPNEHTAGVRSGRQAWWSWRRMWVPVTVAAALAGGVFVGAQLPSGSDKVSTASGGPTTGQTTGATGVTTTSGGVATPAQNDAGAGSPATVGRLGFTLADGWQSTKLSDTSACVTLKSRPAPTAPGATGATSSAGTDSAGTGAAALPCGADALYLKSDADPKAWPLSTAATAAGWWPGQAASPSGGVECPVAQPTSADRVKQSFLLRTAPAYGLAAQTTAEYHEWAVTCDSGPGVRAMLWKLNAPGGTAAPATFGVATVVSADPQYDSALLGMVGSLHQAS